MSQRKLKKIRKEVEEIVLKKKEFNSSHEGIREILRKYVVFLIITLVIVLVMYFNAMNADFVSDDYATIPNNPQVADIGYNLSSNIYRNTVSLSNTFIAAAFGINSPIPYHVYSLIIFMFICVGVFLLTYLLMGEMIAMITTLIFSVLPIHVEAVSWISGKPYILSSMFVLYCLVCVILFLNKGKKKYLWLSVLMFAGGYFSESVRVLSTFLLIPFLLILRGAGNMRPDWKKIIIVSVVAIPLIMFIAWPRILNRINIVNSGYNVSEGIFYDPFFQYPTAIAKYLQLLLVPVDLTLYHTMYIFPVWLNWAIFLSYLSLVVYFYFKDKRIFFALSFIFVATAPSMAPVKVAWLVAERYMFLGSVGFCMFLGIILSKLGEYSRIGLAVVLGSIVALYGVRVIMRNIDWQTNHNLWVNTCQVSPNSHNAWNNIGDDYDKLKQYDNAVKGFTQSTIVKPNYADAYHNRANIFFKTGRLDLARDSYNTALYYSPTLYQTYLSLTQIDLMENKLDLALEHASKAYSMDQNSPQAAYVLGVVYAQAGDRAKATSIFKEILRVQPKYKPAADALIQLGLTS